MFLSNKKLFSRGKDKDKEKQEAPEWAAIFSKPLSDEVRGTLIHGLGSAFSMSFDEAENIIANTPIILLDNLSQSAAVQVKNYFQRFGAEIFLTKDAVMKSKCYRTVWPEAPDLSFLETKEEPAPAVSEQAQPATQEEPVQEEVYSAEEPGTQQEFFEEPDPAKVEEAFPEEAAEEVPAGEKDDVKTNRILKSFDQWKDKYQQWKKSLEQLSHEVEDAQKESRKVAKDDIDKEVVLEKQEKTLEEQRQILEQVETKYRDMDKAETGAYAAFKDQLGQFTDSIQAWKQKIEAASQRLNDLEKLKANLAKRVQGQSEEIEKIKSSELESHSKIEVQMREIAESIEQWEGASDSMTAKLAALNEVKNDLEGALRAQEENYEKLDELGPQAYAALESQVEEVKSEITKWRSNADQVMKRLDNLDEVSRNLSDVLNEQRTRYEQLSQSNQKNTDYFKKQLGDLSGKIKHWEETAASTSDKLATLQKLKFEIERSLSLQKDRQAKLAGEGEITKQLDDQLRSLAEGIETWRESAGGIGQELENLYQTKESLEGMIGLQQKQFDDLRAEYIRAREKFSSSMGVSLQEVQKWKEKAEQVSGKMFAVEAKRQELEKKLKEQEEKYGQLEKEYEDFKESVGTEPMQKMDILSERLEKLEKQQFRVLREMQEGLKRENFWQQKAEKLDQELKKLQRQQNAFEDIINPSDSKKARKPKI